MFSIIFQFLLLLAGLVLLWWAGDRSVRYAIELSDIIGISSFTVGFIIMSVSTGLPEISTAAFSCLTNSQGLSAGDIMGSSLMNMTLILGVSAFAAGTLSIKKDYESTILKMTAIIAALAGLVFLVGGLTVFHGALLLAAYGGSVLFLKRQGLTKAIVKEGEKTAKKLEKREILGGKSGTFLKLAGSVGVVLIGARLTVESALQIGRFLGVSLELLGATVIAMGTGLPELTLELNSVKRKEYGLALGDLFGSTLVNLTLVLGFLSVLSPLVINITPLLGIVPYFAIGLVFIWFRMVRNHGLSRNDGIFLVVLFIIYLLEEGIIGVL